MNQVYLDNAATTPLLPQVSAAMAESLGQYGNPSSLHGLGVAAEQKVSAARKNVARLLGVSPGNLVFTSGGTEANNLALKGYLSRSQKRLTLVTSSIEHPSVLEVFQSLERLGWEVVYLPVDAQGKVKIAALEEALAEPVQLVSLMAVNNETGAVQPLAAAAAAIRKLQPEACFHVDAVQALGKIPFHPVEIGADLASFSAHKIHGPKGIGALYAKQFNLLRPIFNGGGQEGGLRSGTENVLGIIGFGQATKLAQVEENRERVAALRRHFLAGLQGLPCQVISPADAVPHILAVSFPGFRGEVLLQALSSRGVYVSTGAACSGKKGQLSQVAEAMGLSRELAEGMLRFSFSALNTEAEINYATECIRLAVQELAYVRGRRSQ